MIMMRVIMRSVVVGSMVMRITSLMCVSIAGIGATFRIEWRLDFDDARTQSLDHGFDHVIAPDSQAAACDLRRKMAVAEMPTDANQMLRILAADFQQRLRRRHDLDQPTIFENKRIAATQRHGMLEVEQKFKSARARHRHPSPMPVVEIEDDRISSRLGPALLWFDVRRADHFQTPLKTFRLWRR
jgi:hypothetical protein